MLGEGLGDHGRNSAAGPNLARAQKWKISLAGVCGTRPRPSRAPLPWDLDLSVVLKPCRRRRAVPLLEPATVDAAMTRSILEEHGLGASSSLVRLIRALKPRRISPQSKPCFAEMTCNVLEEHGPGGVQLAGFRPVNLHTI